MSGMRLGIGGAILAVLAAAVAVLVSIFFWSHVAIKDIPEEPEKFSHFSDPNEGATKRDE